MEIISKSPKGDLLIINKYKQINLWLICLYLHYLDVIFSILKSGAQWNTINSKLHYTTYHKRFIYWNKLNIFCNGYNKILEIINSKYINRNFTKNLFIDSTMIKNIKGVDNIGPNKYDRFRNGTKINVIVNNIGIPISVKVNRSNDHDVTITEELINKSMIKIVSSKKYPIYLSGDKFNKVEFIKYI